MVAANSPRSDGPGFTSIRVSNEQSANFQLSSPNDWEALAGSEAKQALAQFVQDCERLPDGIALERYGSPGYFEAESGATTVFNSDVVDCRLISNSISYGLVISVGEISLLITSINGRVFVEEI